MAQPKPLTKKYDASNPDDIKRATQAADLAEKQRVNGLRLMVRTKDGRRWVREMLASGHVFKTSFTGNNGTFFNEGERNQALKVLADLSTHCVPEFLAMIAESAPDPILVLKNALAILGLQENPNA